MAIRLVHAFERQLEELLRDEEVPAAAATVGASIVKDLPFEVRAPHPLPHGNGLLLEWSLGSHLAELEISPDLTMRFSIEIGDMVEEGKLGDLEGPEARAFFGLIRRHFAW